MNRIRKPQRPGFTLIELLVETAIIAVTPIGSPHPGGVDLLIGDGSVPFLKKPVDVDFWRALGSIRGREVISADACRNH